MFTDPSAAGRRSAEVNGRVDNSTWGKSMWAKRWGAGNPRIRQTAHVKTREWVVRWQQAKAQGCTWKDFWFYRSWPPCLIQAMRNDE